MYQNLLITGMESPACLTHWKEGKRGTERQTQGDSKETKEDSIGVGKDC